MINLKRNIGIIWEYANSSAIRSPSGVRTNDIGHLKDRLRPDALPGHPIPATI
ncbi:hypothetical protein ACQ86N_10030 [Puia sp. P3]|uniref:hypothetical protein n=1 Tax=Puia sp. P3 TaxID=3423952 RepID=UPI003D678EA8